jgi:hypothetical protein
LQVSRTFTFGRHGASEGQFYDKYLARIALNTVDMDWSRQSFAHLDKTEWTEKLLSRVAAATCISADEVVAARV